MRVGFPSPRPHGGDAMGPGGCCAFVPQLRTVSLGACSFMTGSKQACSLSLKYGPEKWPAEGWSGLCILGRRVREPETMQDGVSQTGGWQDSGG